MSATINTEIDAASSACQAAHEAGDLEALHEASRRLTAALKAAA